MSKIALFCFLSLLPLALFSQSDDEDASFVATAVKNAVREYEHKFPASVLLHTGAEYYNYDHRIDGFPYFFDEEFTMGSVMLDGQMFNNVSLSYDIHKDKLILEHYNQHNYFERLELVPGKVDSFSVFGYRFFRVNEKTDYDGQLPTGFYNLLYSGDVMVFSKRYKSYLETLNDRSINRVFLSKDKFYIVKNDQISSVRSKKFVLKAFNDKKKQLKKDLKAEHVNFKNNFEKALIRTSEIYDELKSDL